MKINTLEKALKAYQAIQQLDTQIVELEKMAQTIATGSIKIHFEMKVEDIAGKEAEEGGVKFDEDGSITTGSGGSSIYQGIFWEMMNGGSSRKVKDTTKYTSTLTEELSYHTALGMLAILLQTKQQQREALLHQLQEYGVK